MDTLTHAIVGATLARAIASTSIDEKAIPIKIRVWIGGLAAAFPDIDFVTVLINPLTFISDWHRAETHSFVMLPVWALLLGIVFAMTVKRKHQWREFVLICGISILSHIFTDLITSWGTEIFAPLSNYRASWGITFIIDPYFSLIIFTGLIIALIKKSRLVAQLAVVLLATYIGFQSLLKFQAHRIGEQYVSENNLQPANVHTMPQPFSPFNWKIIVDAGESYHMTYVDLIADEHKPLPDKKNTALLHSVYYYRPRQQLEWKKYPRFGAGDHAALAKQVWRQRQFEEYRRFAAYPVLYRIDKTDNNNCVWFMDLRFVIPQRMTPFRYGMCKNKIDQQWQLYRLRGGQRNEQQLID